MKQLIGGIICTILCMCVSVTYSQRVVKRPVAKPKTTAPAADIPKQGLGTSNYNAGLNCGAEAYDCRISAFTKAIDLGLKTPDVFKMRGLAYRGQGSYYKAILDLRNAITLAHADIDLYLELGSTYTLVNQPEAAEKIYTAALALEPKNVDILKQRAKLYLGYGLTDDAYADLSRVISINPKDPEPYELALTIHRRKKDFAAIVADYNGLIAIKPNEPSYYFERSSAFARNENYDAALSDAAKVVELKPDDAMSYIRRAWRYQSKRQYDKARSDFDKAVALAPASAEVLVARANFFLWQDFFDEARADLAKAVEVAPTSAKAYKALGLLHDRTKEFDRSVQDYNKAISLDPDDMMNYYSRSEALLNVGLDSDAMADANKLVAAGFPLGYYSRANVIFKTKGYDAYIKETENARRAFHQLYTAMIELEPTYYQHYWMRAINNPAGQSANALADLTKALMLKPDCRGCLGARVYNLLAADRPNEALADASKIIELNPASAYSYTERIAVYKKMGKIALALADATKAIEVEPTSDSGWSARSDIYRDQKDFHRALVDYIKVFELNPRKGYIAGILSDRYKDAGDLAGAERMLNKRIEIDPKDPYSYHARAFFYEYELKDKKRAVQDYLRCANAEWNGTGPTDTIKKDCAKNARDQ
ncbi:MAG TPA: tetratricopeptide repeat protein [Pyrinomonadaceae bacterium]|nr:tetratricopeptide repeat protein [Pyrinomonadaceae bacterium]